MVRSNLILIPPPPLSKLVKMEPSKALQTKVIHSFIHTYMRLRDLKREDNNEGGGATFSNEAMDSAFHNLVIVSEIGRYLDFHQLKRCRLVNTVWEELFSIIMGRRAVIRFHPPKSTHLDLFLPSLKCWKDEFESRVNFMKRFNFGNFKLILKQSRADQVKKDLYWLLDNFDEQLKYLAIQMEVSNREDGVLLSQILSHRLGSLVELDLKIEVNCEIIVHPSPVESVRILKIRDIYQTKEGSDFMAVFLSRSHDGSALSPFPNLKTLELRDGIWGSKFVIKFLQQLKTFPQFGLENLVIDCLQFTQPEFDDLKEALERHAPTLLSLRLDWVDLSCMRNRNFELIFPHFPKLKKLELDVKSYYDVIAWKFPAGQVSYKDDFPLLEDLKVGLLGTDLGTKKNVLETFVPLQTHQNKCHTMKRIHFDMSMHWGDGKIWGSRFWKSFEDLFPNATLMPECWMKVKEDALKRALNSSNHFEIIILDDESVDEMIN